DTQTSANLSVLDNGINDLMAHEARLNAERVAANDITFPEQLLARSSDPLVEQLIASERKLFELRREAMTGQKQQLRERITQLEQQIGGLSEQVEAKKKEFMFIGKELDGVRALWAKQLVPI